MTFTNSLSIKLVEENGEFYSEGFIATTHPDRAPDPKSGTDGDIISKEALAQIANMINTEVATTKSVGATRAVSYRHDWIKKSNPDIEPPGMIVPPVSLKETSDGHWGVWAKVHHNKHHPQFDKIMYEIKHGYLPGYSIEYNIGDFKVITFKEKAYRFIKSFSNYVGQAFAHARMIANPKALITGYGYKEITTHIPTKEDSIMEEEQKTITSPESLAQTPSQTPEVSVKEEAPKVEEPKAEDSKEETESSSDASEAEPEAKEVAKEKVSTKELIAQLKESDDFKEVIASLTVEQKVRKEQDNKTGEHMEKIQFKELVAAVKENDRDGIEKATHELFANSPSVKQVFADVDRFKRVSTKHNFDIKCVGKGLKITGYNADVETKDSLVTGDNTSAYTQEDVEFADVFQAGIIDTFNNQTNLFAFLPKIPHPVGAGEYYQWKMVTDRDPDSTSTFVSNQSIAVTTNYANKENYQTPLKIARRGVSVSDFIRRYASRSLRDLLQLEIDLQMKELMKDVNVALFAEVADGDGLAPLGLEAVADSAGNTTLYGKTRSTANRLSPDAAGDTYTAVGGNLTEAVIRAKVTQLENEGSRKQDIAIVTSPEVRDYLFNLLDGNRRFHSSEVVFGFNKMLVPTYDGFPIIVDSDCNSDALYIIDTAVREGANIVIGMEPQIIELAKVGMSTEAVIEMHFAFVYHQPRRIGMLDTLSGPST